MKNSSSTSRRNKKDPDMPIQTVPTPMLKGHMGLKSSPYAINATKLTGQHIVQDHMTAHYRMINNAKTAIDTSTPKAWLISQKVRDRARREALKQNVLKSRSRPPSRSSSRHSNTSLDGYLEEEDPYSPYHRAMRGPVKANHDIRVDFVKQNEMPFVEKMLNDTKNSPSVYQSPRPIRSNIPNWVKSGSGNPPILTPRKLSAGDLLKDHSSSFTEPEKPFTPRTLKTNRKSKLSEFRYYNPPPQKKNGKSAETPQNSGKNGSGPPPDDKDNLMFETLQSRDFSRINSGRQSDVPKLDITVDQDHMKWLHEQATKAQYRSSRDSMKRFNESMPQTVNRSGAYSGPMGIHELGTIQTARSMDREEELMYLDFVRDVTSDVLDRGIFTNRVLKQVFQHHLEKHKNSRLKMGRMQNLLNKLRDDLGIPQDDEDDDEDDENYGFKSTISMSSSINHHDMDPNWQNKSDAKQNEPRFAKTEEILIPERISNSETFNGQTERNDSYISEKNIVLENSSHTNVPTPRKRRIKATDSVGGSNPVAATEINYNESDVTADVADNTEYMRQLNLEESDNDKNNYKKSGLDELDAESESTEVSTDRLPENQQWMRNNKSFTMTLKPGQLDMTLVKPKARDRRRRRSFDKKDTASSNERTVQFRSEEEGNDELRSTLTDITPIEDAAVNEKSDTKSNASRATESTTKGEENTAEQSGDDNF